MRLYVGVTDTQWFNELSTRRPDEVNFWQPGGGSGFSVLQPGELFLFKLKAPLNAIVGGGYFVKYSKLPVSLAWLAFENKNGVNSLSEFLSRIRKYRRGSEPGPDPTIGCIVLTQPFWFPHDQWIPQPDDWPSSTVQGKGYDPEVSTGYQIYRQVLDRISPPLMSTRRAVEERYGRAEVNVRLGQGAFRVLVTDAYSRKCAITGESTLPVLESAHIQPYAEGGPHEVGNGILLRSDMHILFDQGLLGITPDHKLAVSPQIREQYSNGKLYYSYHGQELRSVPQDPMHLPAPEFLEWHQANVFLQ